jgi:hypothetical protein
MDPMIGQVLGHYRIEAKLGEGRMGVVWGAGYATKRSVSPKDLSLPSHKTNFKS